MMSVHTDKELQDLATGRLAPAAYLEIQSARLRDLYATLSDEEKAEVWAGHARNFKWPRPKNDWILVLTDPLAEKHGSIILPGKGSIYTATVLAVGPGTEIPIDHNKPEEKRFIPTDVKPGEMVAFLRWTIESQQGKAVKSTFEELGANIALIKERDILFVLELEPDEKVVLTL